MVKAPMVKAPMVKAQDSCGNNQKKIKKRLVPEKKIKKRRVEGEAEIFTLFIPEVKK